MTAFNRALILLALLFALAGAPLVVAAPPAQGGSRNFPETGQSVGGKFLEYWESHGGLAQQGYPISPEIQETSPTDGKIYTVQYFERAVFEYHPENQPPNDVLLSLLGTFLYKQKYPQGAPGQVANLGPDSRAYSQTGKTIGGVFRQYWDSHGGLAQQGFPISEEFDEVSDLNGQTYKVQYFERAVFELHPENQPPFNVLLSQLGKFRQRARYGGLTAQLTGAENMDNTPPVALKAGLATFQSVRAADDGYYYIDLLDPAGQQIATVAARSGPTDMSSAVPIPADGNYTLRVQAGNAWTINIAQPKASYVAPPAAQHWSGKYWQATALFSLRAGQATFHAASANNKEEFRVDLLDQNGVDVDNIASGAGPTDAANTIEIPADGVYLIQVLSDGAWSVDVQQ